MPALMAIYSDADCSLCAARDTLFPVLLACALLLAVSLRCTSIPLILTPSIFRTLTLSTFRTVGSTFWILSSTFWILTLGTLGPAVLMDLMLSGRAVSPWEAGDRLVASVSRGTTARVTSGDPCSELYKYLSALPTLRLRHLVEKSTRGLCGRLGLSWDGASPERAASAWLREGEAWSE